MSCLKIYSRDLQLSVNLENYGEYSGDMELNDDRDSFLGENVSVGFGLRYPKDNGSGEEILPLEIRGGDEISIDILLDKHEIITIRDYLSSIINQIIGNKFTLLINIKNKNHGQIFYFRR